MKDTRVKGGKLDTSRTKGALTTPPPKAPNNTLTSNALSQCHSLRQHMPGAMVFVDVQRDTRGGPIGHQRSGGFMAC